MQAESLLSAVRRKVDARLDALLPPATEAPERLHEAMRYGCLTSGKRIRPALCLASAQAAGGLTSEALDAACALEMVHAFSLIHDDLPAIDDDPLRRGLPSCHVKFGEALAILAGDALFSLAFRTMLECSPDPAIANEATRALAQATGSGGLVGGEVMDVLAEGRPATLDEVRSIHARKTAALMSASCEIGGMLGGADTRARGALREFGNWIGIAFQVADDVLNAVSTSEELGKAAGSDSLRDKATYPALLGIEASRKEAREAMQRALDSLSGAGLGSKELEALAAYAIERAK